MSVIRDELRHLLANQSALLVLIGGLVIYAWLYPLPYQNQQANELPIAVVDSDQSQASRTLIRYLAATPEVQIAARPTSQLEAEQLLRSGEVSGLLLIPLHFETDLRRGVQPQLAMASDGSYFLAQGKLEKALGQVVTTLASRYALTEALQHSADSSVAPQVLLAKAAPLNLELQALYNENLGYGRYVIPAVFALLLQQLLVLGSMLLAQPGQSNNRYSNSHSPLASLLARTGILLGVYLLGAAFLLGPALVRAGVTPLGELADLLWLLVPYLLASTLLGSWLGTWLPHPALAAPLALFSSMPILFASGAIWPLEAMPAAVRVAAELIPSTQAISALVKLAPMGAARSAIAREVAALWLMVGGFGLLACLRVSRLGR